MSETLSDSPTGPVSSSAERLREVCRRFEVARETGQARIEDFAAEVGEEERPALHSACTELGGAATGPSG